ncbi:hypothetical protein AB4865_00740 [Capnocytophaga sp. ARDL2]|uniref:hypothetical protein n=1 Tax=Capnocytophaga sp. ARDL2 TaxID=3238809 RepID=UPI003557B6ED
MAKILFFLLTTKNLESSFVKLITNKIFYYDRFNIQNSWSGIGGDRPEPNRPYTQDNAFNKDFNNRKKQMHSDITKREYGTDVYTGKKHKPGDAYDYEHIVSKKEIFDYYKHKHTDAELNRITNTRGNVEITSSSLNRTKGKYSAYDKKDLLINKYGAKERNITKYSK